MHQLKEQLLLWYRSPVLYEIKVCHYEAPVFGKVEFGRRRPHPGLTLVLHRHGETQKVLSKANRA